MSGVSRGASCLSRLTTAAQWYPAGVDILPTLSGTQQVRWGRMRLDPPIMRRRFYVRKERDLLLGEQDEADRLDEKTKDQLESTRLFLGALYQRVSTLTPQYRTNEDLASSRQFLDKLYAEQVGEAVDPALAEMAEEQEHREMMEYNRLENERLADIRNKRMRHAMDDKVEEIMLEKLRIKEEEEQQRLEALRVLQETEEFCKSFVAPEDILKELERAFDNPVDYCYAIDKRGNMYLGHATKPTDVDPEDRPHLLDPDQPKTGPIKLGKENKSIRTAAAAASNS